MVANPVKLEYLPDNNDGLVFGYFFTANSNYIIANTHKRLLCINQLTNNCQFPLTDEPPVQHLLPVHLHQMLPHLAHQPTLHLLLHLQSHLQIQKGW